jgi:O-6-methylguanine DNA methyltransferase
VRAPADWRPETEDRRCSHSSPFARRVLAAVRRIPAGAVATYGDIAALAGSPRAARAVGSILRECSDPYTPCHRVVAAAGGLGGFGSYLHVKRERLLAEGVDVRGTRIRRFSEVRWTARRPRATRTRRPHV